VKRLRLYGPPTAQAPLGKILRASLGAALGLAATGALIWLVSGSGDLLDHPMLVAPFAASAVLIFAVPSSPLAQPWVVVVGNGIAALCGLVVLALMSHPLPGMALAVFASIPLMAFARALHPPAGGMAAFVVLASAPGSPPDWMFLLSPVLSGSVILVAFGVLWHHATGTSYPFRP
jgi:CBS domain-containing membrane protein